MATDLKVSVRREIERLRKDLAVATRRVAALQDEIKRHELVYSMLDGRRTGKRSRRGRCGAGALKRGPRGAMIDRTAVFATLPCRFTLDSLFSPTRRRARRPEATSGRWWRGGRRTAGSDAPAGACTRRPDSEETGRDRRSRVPTRPFAPAVPTVCIRTSPPPEPGPLAHRKRFAFQRPVGYPHKSFPQWPQAMEGQMRWRQPQIAGTWRLRRP